MKKAINIMLLPSEEMMDNAIKINEELIKYFDRKIVLNKNTCFPHISIARSCIEDKDVSKIEKILKTIGHPQKMVFGIDFVDIVLLMIICTISATLTAFS
jgi:hypothetical protein